MQSSEQSQPTNQLAKKILEWPRAHPVLTLVAVVALSVVSYLGGGPSGGVEACNDAGVVQTLQQSLAEKVAGIRLLDSAIKTEVSVSTITQLGFDKDNKIRSCEADVNYRNYPEGFAPMLKAYRACSSRVQYKITRPLDAPKNYYINWVCR